MNFWRMPLLARDLIECNVPEGYGRTESSRNFRRFEMN